MKQEHSRIPQYRRDGFIGADLLDVGSLGDSDRELEEWEREFIVHQLLVSHLQKIPGDSTGIYPLDGWPLEDTGSGSARGMPDIWNSGLDE